jgi:hypothetical protein
MIGLEPAKLRSRRIEREAKNRVDTPGTQSEWRELDGSQHDLSSHRLSHFITWLNGLSIEKAVADLRRLQLCKGKKI